MTDSNIIPNSLSITIHTDIPGYQNVNFKPSMIDPQIGESNKTVWFNPLVKLDMNVIDKVPPKLRVSEFFKKDYFRSLINYHGMVKKKTLEGATEAGFVDNNISVMLNLLFPTKGIIYINKEPYTIANFDWTKGDWKIDNKDIEVHQLDINRIRNPYTLSHVVNSKIKSGNIALSKPPQSVLQGANYSGPPVIITNPTSTTSHPQSNTTVNTKSHSLPVSKTSVPPNPTQSPVPPKPVQKPVQKPLQASLQAPVPPKSQAQAPAPSLSPFNSSSPPPPSTAIVNAVSNAIDTSPAPPPKPQV